MPLPLNEKVADALNRQLNTELQASHLYRAMAAYFDSQELPGFSSWFFAHAQEEAEHAMRIYSYLVSRNARVVLTGIEQPKTDHSSPESAIAAALETETEVTKKINELFELAHESGEYGTQPLMHWFLEEQVKEEDLFRRLLDQVEAAKDSRWHLLVLDGQLAQRAAT